MKRTITHVILLTLCIFSLNFASYGQTTDLIISEYAEGSSNNKYLEIYNGTGTTVDLTNYELWRISNGGSWPESTVGLTGTLASGEVLVVANSQADTAILNLSNATTAFNSATFFNGDDAVGLAKDDGTGTFVLIDNVGTGGPDPGSGWDVAGTTNGTANYTLVRKPTVCSPDTNWAVNAGTTAANSQWIVFPQNTWTDAGMHTASCAAASGDTIPPAVIDAYFLTATSVQLVFSEPVDATTAQNTANYSITPGITVTNSVLNASMDTVTLTLSPAMTDGVLYTGNASGVTDTSSNANVMVPFMTTFYFNSYSGSDLMITEIYHSQPSSGIQDIDYFEIYNAGTSAVPLGGLTLNGAIDLGIDSAISLAAGSYFVFTENADSFALAFPTVTNVLEWESGSLSGGGSQIRISNSFAMAVAEVNYATSAPWPAWSNVEAIEICDLSTDYTMGENWYYAGTVSSTVGATLYGTPGAANSCAPPPVIPTYDIEVVRTVDADGVADSLGVYCAVEGIVHGKDLDGNNGLSFYIIDDTRGINVFNFNDVDNYVVTEGDEIRVVGEIDQFRGLIEIIPDSITVLSTGNCIDFPTVVDDLGEDTESEYIEFKNVTMVDPMSWPSPGSSTNLDFITSDGDTLTMRLDGDTDIQDTILNAPSGVFNLIGIGGQFDGSSPYFDGYQIFPMFVRDIDTNEYNAPADIQFNEVAVENMMTYPDSVGNYYQWMELYNFSGTDENLSGYFISTDSTDVFGEVVRRCYDNMPLDMTLSDGQYGLGFLGADPSEGPAYFETELDVAEPFIGLYTPNGQLVHGLVFSDSLNVEGHTFGAKDDDYGMGAVTFENGTPTETNANGTILSVRNDLAKGLLKAYPNPNSTGMIFFNETISFNVYSISGNLVDVQVNVNQMNTSEYNAGVYLIKTTDGAVIQMIIK